MDSADRNECARDEDLARDGDADDSGNAPNDRVRPGPVVIAAFEGFSDAADAATGVVEHLALSWNAEPLTEIDSERYYDYQVNRPLLKQVGGVTRGLEWPVTRLLRCAGGDGGREVILVHGIEPNLRWRGFCAELLDIFIEERAAMVVSLGALLADTPHTRPVPISGSAYDAEAARRFGLAGGDYQGPAGVAAALQDACVQEGMPAFTLWAAVPHYLSQPPNARVMLALLRRLGGIVGLPLPFGELPRRAREWLSDAEAMTSDDEDITDYVRTLEERYDEETEAEAAAAVAAGTDTAAILDDLGSADGGAGEAGEAIAAEFERYLRGRGGD